MIHLKNRRSSCLPFLEWTWENTVQSIYWCWKHFFVPDIDPLYWKQVLYLFLHEGRMLNGAVVTSRKSYSPILCRKNKQFTYRTAKGRYIFFARNSCVCVAALKTFPSPRLRLSVIDRTSRFFAEGKSLCAGVWEKQLVNLGGGGGEIFGTKVGAAADISGCLFLSGEEYNFPFPNDASGKKIFARQTGAGGKTIRKIGLGTKLYRIQWFFVCVSYAFPLFEESRCIVPTGKLPHKAFSIH